MALEEKDIMQHRIVSEKVQILGSLLNSSAIVNPEHRTKVEDLLVEMLLTNFKYESE